MTDEGINRKFDLVAEHLANIAQAQMKTDVRIDRLERIVRLAVRAGLRERRNTREKINALIAASERADERMDALAVAQKHSEEAFTAFQQQVGHALSEMAQAVIATNKRIDLLERNGKE